jgi:outer membrane protein assembly factor BamB
LPKAIREVLNPPPSGTIAAGTHGKTVWLIRAEGLKAQGGPTDANSWRGEPYVLHVEGWSPQTGRRVYSRQLANSRTDRADSVCWLLDAPTGRLYVSIPTYTAAIDVETGEVAWEIGFGVTGSGDLLVLGPFVTLQCGPGCIVFGAVEGEIVVSTGWQDVRLDPARFRLLDGRLWARDSDGRWYFLDFSNTHAPWSEPAEQELPGNASERAAQPPRENASEPARMR